MALLLTPPHTPPPAPPLLPPPAPSCATYVALEGAYDLAATDLAGGGVVADVGGCCAACASRGECVGFTLFQGVCYLKACAPTPPCFVAVPREGRSSYVLRQPSPPPAVPSPGPATPCSPTPRSPPSPRPPLPLPQSPATPAAPAPSPPAEAPSPPTRPPPQAPQAPPPSPHPPSLPSPTPPSSSPLSPCPPSFPPPTPPSPEPSPPPDATRPPPQAPQTPPPSPHSPSLPLPPSSSPLSPRSLSYPPPPPDATRPPLPSTSPSPLPSLPLQSPSSPQKSPPLPRPSPSPRPPASPLIPTARSPSPLHPSPSPPPPLLPPPLAPPTRPPTSPSSSPPPHPPPLSPGEWELSVANIFFTLEGEAASFNSTDFLLRVASLLEVSPSQLSLSLLAGSVVVQLRVEYAPPRSAAPRLDTLLDMPSLRAALRVGVLSTPSIVVNKQIIRAPSRPPPASPPPPDEEGFFVLTSDDAPRTAGVVVLLLFIAVASFAALRWAARYCCWYTSTTKVVPSDGWVNAAAGVEAHEVVFPSARAVARPRPIELPSETEAAMHAAATGPCSPQAPQTDGRMSFRCLDSVIDRSCLRKSSSFGSFHRIKRQQKKASFHKLENEPSSFPKSKKLPSPQRSNFMDSLQRAETSPRHSTFHVEETSSIPLRHDRSRLIPSRSRTDIPRHVYDF